jgi:putative transposase
MEFRKQAQTVYYTRYHLVFVTKYRRKLLRDGMGQYCVGTLKRVCKNYPDLQLLEANCDKDHVHLLMSIPPKWQISHAVNLLKSNSSRAMRLKFPFVESVYGEDMAFWSDGYFVSTVGANEHMIKNYIEHQGAEDKGQATLEI